MKYLLLFAGILLCNFSKAQSAGDSVKAVINKMFTAMLQSDTAMLKECFADSAILQTITKNGSVRTEKTGNFIQQVGKLEKNAADERISFSAIHIDGSLAAVWTPYQFYYNNTFSHCGVNSFQLVRINGSWKIQYLIDTRRKDSCVE